MQEIRYYQLMRYAENAVGAEFDYCTDAELEEHKNKFNPDYVDQISEEEYQDQLERVERKFLRMVTGYPK